MKIVIKSLDEEQLDAWFNFVTQVFGPYREYFVRHFFSDPHRSLDSIFVAYEDEGSPSLIEFYSSVAGYQSVPMYDSLLELQVPDPSQMSNNRYVNVLSPSNSGHDDSLVEERSNDLYIFCCSRISNKKERLIVMKKVASLRNN